MEKTDIWQEYEQGIQFKTQINLYNTVDKNTRFYEGDQWYGIKADALPKPVFNIIKPACKLMTVQIKDRKLAIKFVAEGEREDVQGILGQMNDYARRTWTRLNMEIKNLDGLTNAFNTGDYFLYHWWNTDIETGQPFKGDIDSMIVDSVNVYPGNPNLDDIQGQPYIIIAMRDMVSNVRKLAEVNKVSDDDIKKIVKDDDTNYLAGDVGKIELEGGEKCNVLLKMWKENGEVWWCKSTKLVQLLKPQKANLKLYPIAKMSWYPRKNCFHGVAETTYIIPNQVYLNKQMAFTQLYLMQTAYPKVMFDGARIQEWSNNVTSSIRVNGDVTGVAQYMIPPQMPNDVWIGIEKTMKSTMDLMGVNDAALGNIANPNNKSAFIAVRDAAIVPLESQQQRYHQMMRDVGMIYLDFFINHYDDGRMITLEAEGEVVQVPNELSRYADMVFDTQIEVGESHLWSELNTVYTLDNLLQQGVITPSEYFKRMPDGYIPEREELMQNAIQREQQQMQLAQAQQVIGGQA